MFHVEHMKIAVILLYFLILSVGCNKKDPNPEQKDEIYKDYMQELEIANKSVEAQEKEVEKLRLELNVAVPQTGQIKYAQKKFFEAEKVLDKFKQQRQFFQIKLEQRKADVQQKYDASLNGGKPFPDEEEIKNYQSTLKLQREKIRWDKTKGVKKDETKEKKPAILKEH